MTNHPNRGGNNAARNPTPEEIKTTRESLGLSAKQSGELIYCTERAWHRWESGERRMHPAMWELVMIKTERLRGENV